jgi:hypothetical protein
MGSFPESGNFYAVDLVAITLVDINPRVYTTGRYTT